jgi:uncharacterized RDD family membrane protein YckC
MVKLNLPKKRKIINNASLFKRILAFIVDILIINFVVILPFRGAFNSLIKTSSFSEAYSFLQNNPEIATRMYIIMFFITLLTLVYFIVLEYKVKQTVGKMLLKIYIVSDEKQLSVLQCIVRNIFLIPFFPFFLLWVIDPLYLLFAKRRFSEVISKTRTVEEYELW